MGKTKNWNPLSNYKKEIDRMVELQSNGTAWEKRFISDMKNSFIWGEAVTNRQVDLIRKVLKQLEHANVIKLIQENARMKFI